MKRKKYPRGRYNDALKHLFRRGGKRINIIDTNLSPFFSVEYSFCISVKLEKKNLKLPAKLWLSSISAVTSEVALESSSRRHARAALFKWMTANVLFVFDCIKFPRGGRGRGHGRGWGRKEVARRYFQWSHVHEAGADAGGYGRAYASASAPASAPVF